MNDVHVLTPDELANNVDLTDDGIAIAFARRYEDNLRYVAQWSRWLQWAGTRWSVDETVEVFDKARIICREVAELAHEKPAKADELKSARTIAAIERLARSDRRLAATTDQWDTDPYALNTPGGIVDLTTGDVLPHDRGAYHTKQTSVAPQRSEHPLWSDFLIGVTAGDDDLIGFLRRLAGYCLTGITTEQIFAYLFGTGRNGKGTFINTMSAILGDYAAVAGMESFVAHQQTQHPVDLAVLRGARLVTAQEIDEGRQWSEARLKTLTGGDPITARVMHGNPFTYIPTFKLILSGNHKPHLRRVDEAIRARLALVPFTVLIPPDERDKHLADKLKSEWPAILQWMIDGCLEWQAEGLNPPEAVRNATAAYLDEEDAFAVWLEECCTSDPAARERSSDLYSSWKAWADKAGEPTGSQKAFSQTMIGRRFEQYHDRTSRGFKGLRLNRRDYTDSARYGG
jgi:P4 family phage/plasmid primase-like protien